MKRRLDATFERVKSIDYDMELQSIFAAHLCVLVSGYMEKAVVELLLEHVRRNGAPTLESYVESSLKRFTNAKAQRIQELLGSFDTSWREALERVLVDERKDAVDSVVDLRNKIAHGGSTEVTYIRISQYYKLVQDVIDEVANLCAPQQC